jgi:hypothetical protein
MNKNLTSQKHSPMKREAGGVNRFPKTFVFDSKLPQQEYHKFISPENIISEKIEVATKAFSSYRTVLSSMISFKFE